MGNAHNGRAQVGNPGEMHRTHDAQNVVLYRMAGPTKQTAIQNGVGNQSVRALTPPILYRKLSGGCLEELPLCRISTSQLQQERLVKHSYSVVQKLLENKLAKKHVQRFVTCVLWCGRSWKDLLSVRLPSLGKGACDTQTKAIQLSTHLATEGSSLGEPQPP